MPTFDFTADDDHGRARSGRITAPAWSAAQDDLRSRGWIVRTLQVASENGNGHGEELRATATIPHSLPSPPRPLSLVLSFQALAEEMPSHRGRVGIAAVARRIEEGQPLEQAVREEQDRLPADLRGLIALGLPSGRVDFLINDYLDHCRRNVDLRRSFRVSLAYPIALIAILIALLGFMNLAIVPKFTRIFEDFGTELPWLTKFVTGASSSLVYYWPVWVAVLVGVPLVAYALFRVAGGPGGPQAVWRSIPVMGQGFRWASLSNFCQLLATLMELKVPLPQAIRAAADMNDDYSLVQGAHRAALAIERGESPRQAVCQPGHWLSELGAAFHWADRGGDFVESLRASGEVFNARSRVQTNLLMYLFEPVVLVTLAVTVGAIILALFMPLIKLLNDLS